MDHSDSDENNNRSNILVLFDVDGTLTPSRRDIEDEMDQVLGDLMARVSVGLVGGSDIIKISGQLLSSSLKNTSVDPIKKCIERFDYVFAENGLVAYKKGNLISKQSMVGYIGEKNSQRLINFCLHYMSQLDLPAKRGNFIEFRTGLINVCPVGRSCSQSEREEFNAFDKAHKIREKFIGALKEQFGPQSSDPIDLVYSIGGQISFDVFPRGWDKTFCLDLIGPEHKEVYFFGDKTSPGGNDHEIYSDPRTKAFTVKDPADTVEQLKVLKLIN